MAAADAVTEPHDRKVHRRRPFTKWVKKLANFKSSSDGDRSKRHARSKRGHKLNNPYPHSGHVSQHHGVQEATANDDGANASNEQSTYSLSTAQTASVAHSSVDGLAPPVAGTRSMAGTVSTENETPRSLAPSHGGASSLAGTGRTVGGGVDGPRGGDSTFSSPAPSVRSLTTTLTTIQSVNPNGLVGGGSTPYVQAPSVNSGGNNTNTQSIQFSQPFSTASPASAIPSHLAPTSNPTTYVTATANNLLTDNASILTLASSSKRRRRRSMDTDASVRALAPSSLWGGSRESLPLSVLSANVDQGGMPVTPGLPGSSSRLGQERNSIYSATGIAPTIANERGVALTKQSDGASVRSARLGHARPDSICGSVVNITSPLASPREVAEGKNAKDQTDENGSKKG